MSQIVLRRMILFQNRTISRLFDTKMCCCVEASVFSFTHSLRVGRDYLVNSTQLYNKTRLSYTNLCLLCYKK